MGFSPFENRLCRDIRNELAQSFLAAIREKRMDRVEDTVLAFLSANRSAIPPIFRSDLLISALSTLDTPPPKLMPTH